MVWEAVYADGLVILRSALVCKQEVLWRLTKKPAGFRLVKTCSLFFWPSTDTREKRRQSLLLVWDAVHQAHPLICIEKKNTLKQAWVRFMAKQENLRGTCRLHALVHVFVSRSDAQAKLDDSISK